MTPFGIRKKLKALLRGGRRPPPPRPAPRPRVELAVLGPGDEEQRLQAAAEDTLVMACANLARPIATGCADATCATCRVEVLEGADGLSPQSEEERRCLKENGHPDHLRLGCQARLVRGPVRVRAFEFVEV